MSSLILHFINVGQGDTTFIELPNDQTMLIDCNIFQAAVDPIEYLEEQRRKIEREGAEE